MSELEVKTTDIPGLLIIELPVQVNPGGWFVENWHQADLTTSIGTGFLPVQHNITHVEKRGVTRGFHAEPWDRYVSVLSGRAFAAWVDLREGESFGRTATQELVPGTSVFVPRGVGNAHQVLSEATTFSYLMAEHWTPEGSQRTVSANLFDPTIDIHWPILKHNAVLSERDLHAPYLSSFTENQSTRGTMFRQPGVQTDDVQDSNIEAFRVLFVCTANICRSAYADVVARSWGSQGIEFASAGTHALTGDPIDPPMGNLAADRGNVGEHEAQQLNRELVESADLILAMASEHRRYILDEWPSAARKIFIIGHAAREIREMPIGTRLEDVTDHLWHNRNTGSRDEVADPYRRGQGAAIKAARSIDTHLEDIIPQLQNMVDGR